MFNEKKFRLVLFEKGVSLQEIAALIGTTSVTLYRKMSGESDFYRKEISQICDFIGREYLVDIFFAE